VTGNDAVSRLIEASATPRPLGACWRHFYLSEQQPEDLAEAVVDYQRRFSWDLLVVPLRHTFYGESWGNEYVYGDDEETVPSQMTTRIVRPESFLDLEILDPEDAFMGEQLTCLRHVHRKLGRGVPYLPLIRSPLAVADMLIGDPTRTLHMMRDHREEFRRGLEAVASSVASFAALCIRSGGAPGIFLYEPPIATADLLSPEEFEDFCRPYDMIVLESVMSATLNALYVPGAGCLLDAVLDYPVQLIGWDSHLPGNPAIADVLSRTDKTVLGGLNPDGAILEGDVDKVRAEAEAALEAAGGSRLILGPNGPCRSGVSEETLQGFSEWLHQER
jgi:uroporphyrinogen decarboxylase